MDDSGELFLRLSVFIGLGLVAGFLSGLFGIGGGIVRIPAFVYLLPLLGVEQSVLMHVAIGTSVALVVPTAMIATRKQMRLGNLDTVYYKTWAIGILFGAVIGIVVLPYCSTTALKTIFAAFLLIVACYVGLVKETFAVAPRLPRGALKIMLSATIGCCATLTGTGGGALTTPAVKAFGYPLKRAIALASASGIVIGVVSTVAVIAQGWNVPDRPNHCLGYIDLLVFAGMLPTTLIGAPLGASVSNSMDKRWLKRIYTLLLLVVATDMIVKIL